MCPPHERRPLLVLLPVLSALLALLVSLLAVALAPHPAAAAAGPARSDGPEPSAEVARLYEEAGRITEAYERGTRAAAVERQRAARLQEVLDLKRRELAVLQDRMGEVARAQYRGGGSLALTARLLLADDPEAVLRAQRVARQADLAVNRLMERTSGAERRLVRAEATARAAWHALERSRTRLAALKRDLEARLERAAWRLQAEADRSVAAGGCRGAVRLDRPGGPTAGPPWVAPVEEGAYTLSAGFDRVGRRWAHRHTGQDFAVAIGTPVRSIGAGRVVSVSCGGPFGIEVVVRHAGGWHSQYAHLASAAVDRGETVTTGRWIGLAGTTGNSTGPHLHFEVRVTPHLGSGVDPVRWLREHGVPLGAS
ncbi:peptidoglycan DD-metalloendopeptidase family protein [Streptomyces sp. NPDC047928]|uniref:M23 family metallopeptidase n=1 Tax=unclassified Streptomyces TaxID=2593676 RepID=UPI00371D90E3